MADDQIQEFVNEIFPEMMRFIEGEPTQDKVEEAFWQALERRQKVAASYMYDNQFRDTVNEAMFDSALKEVCGNAP